MGGREAQQLGNAVLVLEVLNRAFLERLAEFLPERRIFFRLVLDQIFQQAQDLLDGTGADFFQQGIFLQNFPRHVQRQRVGVDHPAHEAQVARHQLVGFLGDEDFAHIQSDAMLGFAIPEIKGRIGREIQQQCVLIGAFHPTVHAGQRGLEVVGDVLVELFVLFVADLVAILCPQGRGAVDGFPLRRRRFLAFLGLAIMLLEHLDRQGNVIGELADDAAQLPAIQEFVLALSQMQGNAGAMLRQVAAFQRVITFAR